MKAKLSELIKKDKLGFGFLSAYGWTCSKCVLEGFNKLMIEGANLPDNIQEALEHIDELECECVPEAQLIIDKEGLKLLREREERTPQPDADFEYEDIEKPKLDWR